ncbi:hypothetical protein [Corynebacterium bovis]|uniref:hypothetical protein n=1 Tax=Corynebacterium bovis TaxID=36808 RepID=UPI003138EA49
MGIIPGYAAVYVVCLGLLATENWRKNHDGTRAADVLDLACVVLPMGTMILCTAFIPRSAFHSSPGGKPRLSRQSACTSCTRLSRG